MFRLATCAVLTVVSLYPPPAAASPRTATEETHCLAIGTTLSRLAAAESQVVRMLKDGPDSQHIAELEAHATETARIGADLQRRFSSAYKPTREELEALDRTPIEDLTAQAQACLN